MQSWDDYSATGDRSDSPFIQEETGHINRLPTFVQKRLRLTTVGLELCFNFGTQAAQGRFLSDHATVLGLLGQKAVEHLRMAQFSLALGHYQSVPLLMRTAYITIGVLVVGYQAPRYLDRWLFLTCAHRDLFPGNEHKFERMLSDLERQALFAYDDLLATEDTPEPITILARNCCVHSHPSLTGLAEQFDLDASDPLELSLQLLSEFFGDDAEEALLAGKGNPFKAFNELIARQNLRKTYGHKVSSLRSPSRKINKSQEDPEASFEFGFSWERPNLMDHYSGLLICTTHHLYDVLANVLEPIEREEVPGDFQWHEESLKIMQGL